MVWHAHMLNPRAYLEDCIRKGLRRLWWHGMPWALINATIDNSFDYNVSDLNKAKWVAVTGGRDWENVDDPLVKGMKCAACKANIEIPWTTCAAPEDAKLGPNFFGNGYGDGDLKFACSKCSFVVNKQVLSLSKFLTDTRQLLLWDRPMPGTLLDPNTGKPDAWPTRTTPTRAENNRDPLTFPNRLIKHMLASRIVELLGENTNTVKEPPTMDTVREMIEDALKDKDAIDLFERVEVPLKVTKSKPLFPKARLSVRKMMSRYWENFTPFALDLGGAVMRQGIFVDKMYQIDWLHSPTARATVTRLCKKYERFVTLMSKNPGHLMVPTLDVDLAWHTHQLSPSNYYDYTVTLVKKFVDHDDKIEEEKLDDGFQKTSKKYQEMFNEVYSECTCWYCEAVRSSHINPVGRAFGISNQEKRKHPS